MFLWEFFSEAAVSQAQRGSGMCLGSACQGRACSVPPNPQRCEEPSPDSLLPTGLTPLRYGRVVTINKLFASL